MTLPRLQTIGTSEERRLLLAARHEGPNSQLSARILLSVGLGTAVATGSAVCHAANASTLGSVAMAPTGIAFFAKWVGIAGVALLAGAGAGFAAGTAWAERSRSPTIDQSQHLAPATPFTKLSLGLASNDPLAQAAATLPLPPPRAPLVASPRLQRDASNINTTVSDEVRLIDEARVALRQGEAQRCMRLLSERRSRHPNGVLSPEAALLRIEALDASGHTEATRIEAQHFLSLYPSGPLATKIRMLLARHTSTKDVEEDLSETQAM